MNRFWRFGGWFTVEPVDERKKGWIRRARIHLRRIAADGVKLLLLLVAVYFASMPFWPLAVPPVPAELRAKYPIPEYQPRGNGVAAWKWHRMYPDAAAVFTNGAWLYPSELMNAPLFRLKELLFRADTHLWTNKTCPPLDELLVVIEPQLHAFADSCADEDPPPAPLRDEPIDSRIDSFDPSITILQPLVGYHARAGNVDAALRAFESFVKIQAYYTRGNNLTTRLNGERLARSVPGFILSFQTTGHLNERVARAIGLQLDTMMTNRGTFVSSIVRDGEEQVLQRKTFWEGKWPKDEKALYESQGVMFGGEHYNSVVRNHRRWGWIIGNTRSGYDGAARNLGDWLILESQIWADRAIQDPEQAAGALLKEFYAERTMLFKRGIFAYTLHSGFTWFYRNDYVADADLLIGKSLAAVGAYEQKHGVLPKTLDEALDELGPDYSLRAVYVRNPPEYRRLDDGSQTNAYAYTLTVWGDGGRCPKEGGVSWLVCRNPAFGEAPFRCWQWMFAKKSDKHRVASPEVVWVDNHKDIPRSWHDVPHPVLQVPSDLLSEEPSAIQAAAKLAEKVGWQEDANPPQVTVTSSSLAK